MAPTGGFTDGAQEALRTAQEIVQQKRHSQLDVEHILLALLRPRDGTVAEIVAKLGADAQVQPPFAIPFRRSEKVLTVGWAILRPSPAFAAVRISCVPADRQWARTSAAPCGTRSAQR